MVGGAIWLIGGGSEFGFGFRYWLLFGYWLNKNALSQGSNGIASLVCGEGEHGPQQGYDSHAWPWATRS